MTATDDQADQPAEPYSAAELAAIRDVVEQYNPPTSPQRRLLATIDAITAGGAP